VTITIKSTSKEALLEAGVPRAKIRLVDLVYMADFHTGCAKEVVDILNKNWDLVISHPPCTSKIPVENFKRAKK
jgi:hypothetical protein